MNITAFDLAQRFVGIKEVPGADSNPQILAMLKLDAAWPTADEVPWCSAFVNYIAWLLRLPRSKDLRARSWLDVGVAVELTAASPGFDVVVIKRGDDPVQGHVGFYAGMTLRGVFILSGNQSNAVSVAQFPASSVLGVRRLAP